MNLTSFLIDYKQTDKLTNHVLIFSAQTYSILFFSYFFKWLNQKEKRVIWLHEKDLSFDQLKQHLSMQFLGQGYIYWLGNITQEKRTKELLQYSLIYKGPHIFCFFSSDIESDWLRKHSNLCVELSQRCDQSLLLQINELFNITSQVQIKYFFKKISEKNMPITLDDVCMLMQYGAILSKGMQEQFFKDIIEKIISPNKSLFSLSGYFFAKDSNSFFKLWNLIKQDYSSSFWISFWSEHIFKATLFIYYVQRKDYNSAKHVAHRLPFSFIKQDWKINSLTRLGKLHQELYLLDYQLKNGSYEECLDIFLIQSFIS